MKLQTQQVELYKRLVSNLKHPILNPSGLSKYAIREIKNLYELNNTLDQTVNKKVYREENVHFEMIKISKDIANHPKVLNSYCALAKPIFSGSENNYRNLMIKIIRLEAAIGMNIDIRYDDIIEAAFAEVYLELVDKVYVDHFKATKDKEKKLTKE